MEVISLQDQVRTSTPLMSLKCLMLRKYKMKTDYLLQFRGLGHSQEKVWSA